MECASAPERSGIFVGAQPACAFTVVLEGLREIRLLRLAMKKTATILFFSLFAFATLSLAQTQVDPKWQIHDLNRPVPSAIDSGTASTQETPGRPPSDAVVLFGGKDLSK